MSLPRPTRTSPTRSLYVWVFIAMVTTLMLSFFIFQAITLRLERQHLSQIYDRLDRLQSDEAARIYEDRGPDELETYLKHLDALSGKAKHYLLAPDGKDLVTGEDRSAYLPPPPARSWRVIKDVRSVAAQKSADGKFWFAAVGGWPQASMNGYMPYYFLVAGATVLLCWLASIAVLAPLHRIAVSIARFGRGDLSARVGMRRRDEIGQLAGSFDQMAEQVQRMIEAERRLLADASHELRSPLTRLKLALRLARTSDNPADAWDRIERDVDRMSTLVRGVMDGASMERDFEDGETEAVDVRRLLDEVVRDCAVEAATRGCTLVLREHTDATVMGRCELLRRSVENVVRNAIRFAPEGTAIELGWTARERDVSIAVRDRGPGVRPEYLERIFDPFFRGDDAGSAAEGGSGLGLSIAKRAVLLHEGTIAATNAEPGLRVVIRLPLA